MYNFAIILYTLCIKIASLFNNKAKEWVNGRKNVFQEIKNTVPGNDIIWFHCSSLGEYEQGVPVMELVKKYFPQYKILVTFFSPSGYIHKKKISAVDYYFYLPADTKRNAAHFVDIVKPLMAVFVKYDFWYNYIDKLHRENIPMVFISCNFRDDQIFFGKMGFWFRKELKKITHFFVQNTHSKELLNNIGVEGVTIAGDTRYDRVAKIASSEYHDEKINTFKGRNKLLVLGSSWEEDETMIKNSLPTLKGVKILIAPHVVSENNIRRIAGLFDNKIYRYTEYGGEHEYDIMILDCIGILSLLYRYADYVYVGGGFGKGIHNTLEPAVYAKPVIFGPKYQKFNEAVTLVNEHCGFSIKNKHDFEDIFSKLTDEDFYGEAKSNCEKVIKENLGASDIIVLKISELIRRTKKSLQTV